MHILLTGGTGFIGSELTKVLLQRGDSVTVLSRQSVPCVQKICGAVSAIDRVDRLQAPIDAVINLAGEGVADRPWTAARKQQLRNSRIELTGQLIRHIGVQQWRPSVWINASAIGVYGNAADIELTESSMAQPGGFARELCEQWEAAASAAQSLGARVCIARLGVVLGPGGILARMRPLFRLCLGGRLGSGAQWLSWIHRDDAIAAILFLLDTQTQQGIFNITAPQPVTNAQWTQALAQALHRPAIFHLPACVLRTLMGELGAFMLESQRVLPARLIQAGFQFRYPQLRPALAASVK